MTGGFAGILEQREHSADAFVRGLSPAVRRRVLSRARRDPLLVSQDELDVMTDDQKWAWLDQALTAERERAATAAQTTIDTEGHQ